MVDKYTDCRLADKQYLAQRHYFSRLCHSAPLFFVLGNHDGEFGYRDTGGKDNMAVWSATMRKIYFPNPSPNDFYTGNDDQHRELGHLEDYYAREELDDIVYQEVPQPGHRRFGNTRTAAGYGYRDGAILSSSGHVRVTVSPGKAIVDYVYSFLPNEERNGLKNGAVAHSYAINH